MSKRTKIDPLFEEVGSDHELLVRVVDYYHQTAVPSDEVKAYLEARKLTHPELIQHFKIGYSDRSLGNHLPEKNRIAGRETRERLRRLGLYRDSGHERFRGAITVPILDADGRVVDLYGRMIGAGLRPGVPLHLWLHDGSTSCDDTAGARRAFNIGGLVGEEAVIITSSIIDALTFWSFGLKNVTAVVGAITQEHVGVFERLGIEQLYIGFRRSDDADKAADTISLKLADLGITAHRIVLPLGQDVNDVVRGAERPDEALGDLVRRSVWMRAGAHRPMTAAPVVPVMAPTSVLESNDINTAATPEPVPTPTTVPSPTPETPDIDEHVFTFGERRWRARGLARNKTFESLDVNLMLSCGEGFYVDGIEVYAAKQRAKYIEQAAIEVGLQPEVVKSDLGKVLLALEALVEEAHRKAREPKAQAVEMSEAERAEALELLRDPQLLDRVLADFERVGVVGEKNNLAVGYLAATSRLLDDPLAVVIQSTSAAGKTSLMDALIDFLPDEHRLRFSAVTGQSLYYLGTSEIAHKVLAIAEEEGSSKAAYALKLLQSDGSLAIASTGKDDTGRLVAHEYKVAGPVAIFLTTTSPSVDEELLNRCIVLTVDEGREQTAAIHRRQREARTLEGILGKREKDAILRLHRNAQRLLRPVAVANPFANELRFPDIRTRARRDHPKYLTLMSTIALLHRHQREVHRTEHGGQTVEYVEVTRHDIEIADRLTSGLFRPSIDDLPPQTLRLLRLIAEHVEAKAAEMGVEESAVRFTRRELRDALHLGNTQLKVHLQRLVDLEHVVRHRLGRPDGGQSVIYELISRAAPDDGPADCVP